MVPSKEKFRIRLEEQTSFKPFGELLSKFDSSEFSVIFVSVLLFFNELCRCQIYVKTRKK